MIEMTTIMIPFMSKMVTLSGFSVLNLANNTDADVLLDYAGRNKAAMTARKTRDLSIYNVNDTDKCAVAR